MAVGLGITLATPAAHAAVSCSIGGLEGLAVPGVSVASATPVPVSAAAPAYCDVIGQLNTSGYDAPENSAGFELRLPVNWNSKFLFFGTGGFTGATYDVASENPVDGQIALGKGYAVAITDAGHLGPNTDASFALLAPGKPDEGKLVDYFWRAVHEVTIAGKQLTRGFYDGATIAEAYFDGCSNGGRQALVEATHFPDDYDGIIAGDPFFSRAFLSGVRINNQQLSPETYIPATLLPMIDAAIGDSCGKVDGVDDALIQNPAACGFDPYSLVCKAGGPQAGCLSTGQANTLHAYFSAVRDALGGLVYPGFSVSDLATTTTGPLTAGGFDANTGGFVPPASFTAPEPWGNAGFSPAPYLWQFTDHFIKYVIARNPNFNIRDFPVSGDGFIGFSALKAFDTRTADDDGAQVAAYRGFTARGKLILYHGFSDAILSPFRTINLYQELSEGHGGYARLQQSARLFMVPGMTHCGGGAGPNVFDTLTPLETWVENGVAPDSIVAAHHVNNDPSQAVDRTMPLCPYPTEATYAGLGAVNSAASWSCKPNRRLLDIGPNGAEAGVDRE